MGTNRACDGSDHLIRLTLDNAVLPHVGAMQAATLSTMVGELHAIPEHYT